MPFFAEIIKGCYVRVGIGQHEGRMVYRVRRRNDTSCHDNVLKIYCLACNSVSSSYNHDH